MTALYEKKKNHMKELLLNLVKPTDLLLKLFLSKAHINLDYPRTTTTCIALIKTIDNYLY